MPAVQSTSSAMNTLDPQSSDCSTSLLESQATLENILGNPDAPKLSSWREYSNGTLQLVIQQV